MKKNKMERLTGLWVPPGPKMTEKEKKVAEAIIEHIREAKKAFPNDDSVHVPKEWIDHLNRYLNEIAKE